MMGHNGSHRRIQVNDEIVTGSHNQIWGNGNTVTGSFARVYGDRNKVTGSHARVYGKNNIVTSSFGKAWGTGNVVTGNHSKQYTRIPAGMPPPYVSDGGESTEVFNFIGGPGGGRTIIARGGAQVCMSLAGLGGRIRQINTGGITQNNFGRVTGDVSIPDDAVVSFVGDRGMMWIAGNGDTTTIGDISRLTSVNHIPIDVYRASLQDVQPSATIQRLPPADPLESIRDVAPQPLSSSSDEDEEKDSGRKRKRSVLVDLTLDDEEVSEKGKKEEEEKQEKEDDKPAPPPPRKRRRTKKKEKEDKSCVVCMANKRSVAFVPCGHVCCCPECARKLSKLDTPLKCPECRGKIERVQRLFL